MFSCALLGCLTVLSRRLGCFLGQHHEHKVDVGSARSLATIGVAQTQRDDVSGRETVFQIADELADCLWLILRLADVTKIDLARSLEAKVAAAAVKYPVAKAFGRADKYTAYLTQTESPERSGDGPIGA